MSDRSPTSFLFVATGEGLRAVYLPLLQPRDFFAAHDTATAFTRTGWLLMFWGFIMGTFSGLVIGGDSGLRAVLGDDLPYFLVIIVDSLWAGILGGIAAFIATTLPALWLHLIGVVFLRGRGANLLTNWVIVAAIMVPMVIVTPIAAILARVPAIGTALSIALLLTVAVAAFRAVRIGVIFAYRAETVRAYLVATIATLPLFALILRSI